MKKPNQRIRYVRTGDGVQLAWAEAGTGPVLIKAANWMTHLEYEWESPVWRHWIAGLSEHAKYMLVAGAVAGGGLTVIANAPNPAGFAILKNSFDDGAINPLWLLTAATPPTLVAIFAFQVL